jgi:Ca-activated chloride channel family protein
MFDPLFGYTFEYPYLLLLILLFIFCSKFCKLRSNALYIPHLTIYKVIQPASNSWLSILKWCTIIFSVIALASPIKQHNIINKKSDGVDIVLALDTSGSMRQIGFNAQNPGQNRWEVVQEIVGDFITSRTQDNIGIVVFGSTVMTASPLSFDKKAQQKIINTLKIGIVGDKTALIDSIATSVNILKERPSKSKIIIALTDGDDTASTIPLHIATKLAQKYNIKIYTIAIGAASSYTLKELSNKTNAQSFIALNKQDLSEVYQIINRLEKSELNQNKIVLKDYYYFYPLMLAFLSLLVFVYLKNRR